MQIAVFEGYGMPRGRGGKRGSTMRRRIHRRGGRGQRSRFGAAAKACARSGHKPGTHGFGSCMRSKLKGRGR